MMKKRIFGILLCLCMVLALFPVTAFAEEPGSLAITVDGFKVGKTPNDCTYTFESTIPGITFSEDDIQYIRWDKYAADGDRYPVTNNDAFQAGTLYRCVIDLDSNGLTEVPVVTVNGNTPDYCTLPYFAGVPEKLSIGCDLGTPTEPGSLAIKVDGFQVGNTPKDITLSFASTNLGVTFSADDILRGSWDQYIVGGMGYDWYTMSSAEVFQADTRYKCFINLDNNGLTEAPAVTVNGKTPEYCEIATSDGVPYALLIECELGTPALLTIHGADVVCAQQEYEFTVTAAASVTLDKEFGFDTGGKGSGVDLTIDENGVGHGVMLTEWYDLNTNYFDLSVYGYTADQQFVTATKRVQVSQDHVYVDGVCGCGAVLQYIVEYIGSGDDPICMEVKTHGKDLTLRGETFTKDGYVQTGWVDKKTGAVYKLGDTYIENADVTLNPVFDKIITLTVPFTTTVKLGGDVAPGETVFTLKIVGANAGDAGYADVTVSASVTTNGAGSYTGAMTLTGPFQQLRNMLCEGAFVKQVDGGEKGWTYDDTVWGLLLTEVVALASTDDAAPEYTVLILPATCEETENGMYYDLEWDADPVDQMSFTNTYTKSTSPQTGDNSNLTLWFALLAVSAAGVIGTGVYSKRRSSARAK